MAFEKFSWQPAQNEPSRKVIKMCCGLTGFAPEHSDSPLGSTIWKAEMDKEKRIQIMIILSVPGSVSLSGFPSTCFALSLSLSFSFSPSM